MPDGTKNRSYVVFNSDAEKAKVYGRRLQLAKKKFEEWEGDARAWIRLYKGHPDFQHITVQGHRIWVPSGTANIDAMFASLTAVEVDFLIRNLALGTEQQAEVAQVGIREVFREQNVSEKSGDAIKDSLLVGIGWLKVGYDYAEEDREVARSDEAISQDVDDILNAAIEGNNQPPTPDEIAEVVPISEVQTVVLRDRIVVDYVPWDEVLWDHTAKRFEDIRWIAQRTQVPIHEVKESPAFRDYLSNQRGGLKKLESLKGESPTDEAMYGMKVESDDLVVNLVEYADFITGTICTFAENSDFILNEQPNPYGLFEDLNERSPLVPVILRRSPDSVRGISDMEMLVPSLRELALYRTKLANYLARHVPKLIGPPNALTEAGKNALESPEAGAYIEIEQGIETSQIQPLDPPTLPQEVFRMEERLEDSMREATGVNELMRGLFPDRRRTATETQEVVAASTARQSEKRNRLETMYRAVAKRILHLMQMNYDHERVSRLVGEVGPEVWVWTGESIVMEADLEIHLTPKEADTQQAREDRVLAVTNLLAAMPDVVDTAELARYAAETFGVPKEVVARIIKTAEEKQAEVQAQMQQEAESAAVAEGEAPNPANIPGPLGAEALALAANPGEVPPEVAAGIAGAAPGSEEVTAAILSE